MRARRALATLFACALVLGSSCATQSEPVVGTTSATARDLGAAEIHREQEFAQRDTGPLKLDLFLPKEGPRRSPLVVCVHGGGWDAGFRYLDGNIAAAGATESYTAARLLRSGYAVATVDNRLSGIAQSPAQVEDVSKAVRWLQQQADVGTSTRTAWRCGETRRAVCWSRSSVRWPTTRRNPAVD